MNNSLRKSKNDEDPKNLADLIASLSDRLGSLDELDMDQSEPENAKFDAGTKAAFYYLLGELRAIDNPSDPITGLRTQHSTAYKLKRAQQVVLVKKDPSVLPSVLNENTDGEKRSYLQGWHTIFDDVRQKITHLENQ